MAEFKISRDTSHAPFLSLREQMEAMAMMFDHAQLCKELDNMVPAEFMNSQTLKGPTFNNT